MKLFQSPKVDTAAVLIALAMIAAWWVLGVGPIQRARADADRLTDAIALAANQADDAEQRLKRLTSQLDTANAEMAAQPITLRAPEAINTLLSDLAETSKRLNVRLDAVTPRPPTTNAKYRVTPIDVQAEAGYIETGRWLTALRKRFPDVSLVGLSIERTPSGLASTRAQLVWFSAVSAKTPQTAQANP